MCSSWPGAHREAAADLDRIAVATRVKRRPEEHAADVRIGAQRGPFKAISSAAASGGLPISEFPKMSERRSAAPPTGTPRLRDARPAQVDDARFDARFQNDQAHANARIEMPRRVNASKRPRTKSSACGLSPCTHNVCTPRSRISHWA